MVLINKLKCLKTSFSKLEIIKKKLNKEFSFGEDLNQFLCQDLYTRKKAKLFLKQQFFLIFLVIFCYNCFKHTSKEVTNSQPMASRSKPVLNLFSTWFIMPLQVIHTRKIFSHGKWGKLSIATNLFFLSQCHTVHCSEFHCTVNFLFSFSIFKPL